MPILLHVVKIQVLHFAVDVDGMREDGCKVGQQTLKQSAFEITSL